MPFSAIVITADANACRRVTAELRSALSVDTARSVDHYPSDEDVRRLLHVHTPDIIFLDCERVERAADCADSIQKRAPGAVVVGTGECTEPNDILTLFRSGIRDLLPIPIIGNHSVTPAILNIQELLGQQKPTYAGGARILSFLPAKAGVGASVVAANTAVAMAERTSRGPQSCCEISITTAGMAAFLMKVPPDHSLRSAVEIARRLDEEIWQNLVTHRAGQDIIGPGVLGSAAEFNAAAVGLSWRSRGGFTTPSSSISPEASSLSVRRFSKESARIFLVTTQEVPLHLGRMKGDVLTALELHNHVSILVNQYDAGHALSIHGIEKLWPFRVHYRFVNDYRRVTAALMGTGTVDALSHARQTVP